MQTLASIGVSQPHDGDTKTTARRPCTTDAQGGRDHGHSHDMTDGHGGHGTAVITATTPRPQARRPCTTATGTARPRSCTVTSHAITAYKGTCPRDTTRHATRQPNKHSSEQTFDRTHVPMLHIRQTPGWGSVPPGQKAGAAGSLVLTLNARWNIFGLPVTYEVFTYLVVATVAAPYILCIMFLGLMLMMVERSSGPHRYLAAITHCA